MTTEINPSIAYAKAASLLKTQAILAIIFGSIGIIFGILLTAIFFLASSAAVSQTESIEFYIYAILTPVFMIIPHIYLIVSGVYLLRSPKPTLAKVLSIINIVVGVFWNIILLIFAILYVAQSADYEKGYKSPA